MKAKRKGKDVEQFEQDNTMTAWAEFGASLPVLETVAFPLSFCVAWEMTWPQYVSVFSSAKWG